MTIAPSSVAILELDSISSAVAVSAPELELWLSALYSFLRLENLPLAGQPHQTTALRDWRGEARIVRWTLLRCLTAVQTYVQPFDHAHLINARDKNALIETLQVALELCEALQSAPHIHLTAWQAFCAHLERELEPLNRAFTTSFADNVNGDIELPPTLAMLDAHHALEGTLGAKLREIFVHFNLLLERLKIVQTMMDRDEPLKSSLVLFSFIRRETRRLLQTVRQTLALLAPDEPLYDALDGTAYVLPMELRKVYGHELVGVSEMRSAPMIFARVETACGLLTDCFQQSIVALAQTLVPELEGSDVFPSYHTKLERSLQLRHDLWLLLRTIQRAENAANDLSGVDLKERADDFRRNSMRYLMYKDCETTERFIEEVLHTRRPAELEQILHRFGAYLETLLGQVNMRTVLAQYPFDYPELRD